jgi:hypothetical protein
VLPHRHLTQPHIGRRRTRPALGLVVIVGAGLAATPSAGSAARAPLAPPATCLTQDLGRPTLQGFRFSPRSVDVTGASRTVTFTVAATDTGGPDAASGLRYGVVSLSSPGFARSAYGSLTKSLAGGWVATVVVPRWTDGGTWEVNTLSIGDRAGNYSSWSGRELADRGYPSTLPVTAHSDDRGPTLTGFTLAPPVVDTRARARAVTVSVRATDDRAGIARVFVIASEPGTRHRSYASLRRVSPSSSVYRGRMVVQRWQTRGIWHVDSVLLRDRVGNSTYRSYDRLRGFRRSFRVLSGRDTL